MGDPVPVTPEALRFMVDPTHNGNGLALTLPIVGNALTVTVGVPEVALVQPAPGYVTDKLYTPLANVVEAVNDGATLVEA